MSLTRAIKFEVAFPGLRKADQLAMYKRLWGLQQDLTRAANRTIGALFLLQQGQLVQPSNEDGSPTHTRTLAYQAFSGKWQPYGKPLYFPFEDHPEACGGVKSATAEALCVRIKTDYQDIIQGKKALSTFRELPIYYRAAEINFRPDGAMVLSTFEGRTAESRRTSRVVIRPRELDESQRSILARCQEGSLKHGNASLKWVKPEGRTGKWIFALAWTDEKHTVTNPVKVDVEVPETAEQIVAGIDIGVSQHASWVAFTKMDGTPLNRPAVIPFQRRIRRAVVRVSDERSQRSAFNREALEMREGQGVTRKLRVTAKIRDKIARMKETALREIAAATIAACKARGATLIVIEDHGNWGGKNAYVKTVVDWSREARENGKFFQASQGRMRELLLQVAEREGIKALKVNPAYTSRICHRCGSNWSKHGVYARKGAPEADQNFGRVKWREFICSCGYKGHPDHNAAINIARRGIEALAGPIAEPKKKPSRKPLRKIVETSTETLAPVSKNVTLPLEPQSPPAK